MTAVPASFEEIDLGWLRSALATGSSVSEAELASVESVRVEPLDPEAGFLGQHARLHLAGTAIGGALPDTLLLKLPTDDPGGRAVGSMLGAWAREARFYAEVAPRGDAAVPTCFYNGADPEQGRFALLLADIAHTPVEQAAGATPDQVEQAVRAIARFHRMWWNSPTVFSWMPGFDVPGIGRLQAAITGSLAPFADRFGAMVPAETLPWLERYAATMDQWVDQRGQEDLTIVHADYQLNNLLFSAAGVVMIDWQTALRGPGPMDLASLLCTGLTVDGRRAHEARLIEVYATATGQDRAWVRETYQTCLLWWMGIFANNLSTIDPPSDAGRALFASMIERTFTAAADNDAGAFLP